MQVNILLAEETELDTKAQGVTEVDMQARVEYLETENEALKAEKTKYDEMSAKIDAEEMRAEEMRLRGRGRRKI